MSTNKPEPVEKLLNDKPVACPICGETKFYKETVQLITEGLNFRRAVMRSPEVNRYTCTGCSHILWFDDVELREMKWPEPVEVPEKYKKYF